MKLYLGIDASVTPPVPQVRPGGRRFPIDPVPEGLRAFATEVKALRPAVMPEPRGFGRELLRALATGGMVVRTPSWRRARAATLPDPTEAVWLNPWLAKSCAWGLVLGVLAWIGARTLGSLLAVDAGHRGRGPTVPSGRCLDACPDVAANAGRAGAGAGVGGAGLGNPPVGRWAGRSRFRVARSCVDVHLAVGRLCRHPAGPAPRWGGWAATGTRLHHEG